MNFRDPNYRKIDEEMRESYKRILGRDLDKDFDTPMVQLKQASGKRGMLPIYPKIAD